MTVDAKLLTSLSRERARKAKRAFTTRRVPVDDMRTLIGGGVSPASGDLVLASVDEIGKHTRLELPNGRRARMFLGDEIIVCFGNRYAPDQFEAVVCPDLGGCDLVAAGGIAARELSRHERAIQPTRISPIGLIGDAKGNRLNVRNYAIPFEASGGAITTVLVAGTSMNAGKTLTSASIVRSLKAAGHRVAAIKATGTGAGGDLWIMRDIGADLVTDFTDAGFASTYKAPIESVERAALALIEHAASRGCSHAVVEIADGLQQHETAALLKSKALMLRSIGVLFASYDAMGAKAGVDALRQFGHRVLAVSGRLTRSPLAVREAEEATGCEVFTPLQLQEGALLEVLSGPSAAHDRWIASNGVGNGYSAGMPHAANGTAGRGASEDLAVTSFNREMLSFVASKVMELETSGLCGADRGRRCPGRKNHRNGYRLRRWKTAEGLVHLMIPKLRKESYFPAFLKPRSAAEQALLTVAREARTEGAPTGSIEELVKAMGMVDISSPQLVRLCSDIEQNAQVLRARTKANLTPCKDYYVASPNGGGLGTVDLNDDAEDDVDGLEHLGDRRNGAHITTVARYRATE